jgi:hypothetical protein
MAVSIDNVYQQVLAIANKEQRGYITPQEFNILARRVQLDIFDNYFNELNTLTKTQSNSTIYADGVDSIQEKIDVHEKFNQTVAMSVGGTGVLPLSYKIGRLSYNNKEIQLVQQNDLNNHINSGKLKPSVSYPIYVKTSEVNIQVYPTTINAGVLCNYIAIPAIPKWGYVVLGDKALYNSTTSTDFELHASEESTLTNKILELAGIIINKPGLSEVTLRNEQLKEAKENR